MLKYILASLLVSVTAFSQQQDQPSDPADAGDLLIQVDYADMLGKRKPKVNLVWSRLNVGQQTNRPIHITEPTLINIKPNVKPMTGPMFAYIASTGTKFNITLLAGTESVLIQAVFLGRDVAADFNELTQTMYNLNPKKVAEKKSRSVAKFYDEGLRVIEVSDGASFLEKYLPKGVILNADARGETLTAPITIYKETGTLL